MQSEEKGFRDYLVIFYKILILLAIIVAIIGSAMLEEWSIFFTVLLSSPFVYLTLELIQSIFNIDKSLKQLVLKQ